MDNTEPSSAAEEKDTQGVGGDQPRAVGKQPEVATDRPNYRQAGESGNDSNVADDESFAEVYRRYAPGIYDYLVRTVRFPEAAEDILQATFLIAFEQRTTLRDPAKMKGWLFKIAHNQAMNYFHRHSKEAVIDAPEMESSTIGPEMAVLSAEASELVWSAASSLNSRQHEILELTVRQGLSTAEVAEVLGMRTSHTAVLIHRARESLAGAVRNLLVVRNRSRCNQLAALVPGQVRELTPSQRITIDKHMRYCDTCRRLGDELIAPEAVLAAIAPVALPHHLSMDHGGWQLVSSRFPASGHAVPRSTRSDSHAIRHAMLSRKAIISASTIVVVMLIAGVTALFLAGMPHNVGSPGLHTSNVSSHAGGTSTSSHRNVSGSNSSPVIVGKSSGGMSDVIVLADEPSTGPTGSTEQAHPIDTARQVVLDKINPYTGHVHTIALLGSGRSFGSELFPDGSHALVLITEENTAGVPNGMQAVDLVDLKDGTVHAITSLPVAAPFNYYLPFQVAGEDTVGIAGPMYTGNGYIDGFIKESPNSYAWTVSPGGATTQIWSWSDSTFSGFLGSAQSNGTTNGLNVQPYYVYSSDCLYMDVEPLYYAYPQTFPPPPNAEFAACNNRLNQVLPVARARLSITALTDGTLAYSYPACQQQPESQTNVGTQSSNCQSKGNPAYISLHVGRSVPSPTAVSLKATQMYVLPGPGLKSVTLVAEATSNDWQYSVWTPGSPRSSPVPLTNIDNDMSPQGVWSPSGGIFVTGIVPTSTSGTPTRLVDLSRSGKMSNLASFPPATVLTVLGFVNA